MPIPAPAPFRVAERTPGAHGFDSPPRSLVRRERLYREALGPLREPAVYHWLDDGDPHVDVYVHARTTERPYETMITGGMSDRPMPGLLPRSGLSRRVELVLKIRKAADWAAMILREIAALPFELGVVLAPYGLVEGSGVVRPGSLLRHVMLAPAAEERELATFTVDGEPVSFLRPVFLTEEEFRYALAEGPGQLALLLEGAGEALIVDPDRPSTLPGPR